MKYLFLLYSMGAGFCIGAGVDTVIREFKWAEICILFGLAILLGGRVVELLEKNKKSS